MTILKRRRLLGAAILGAAALAAGAWLARIDYSRKISTDVLDLLPAGERSPELGLVRALASESEARVMLFVLTSADGAPAPPEAPTTVHPRMEGPAAIPIAAAAREKLQAETA